MEHQSPPQTLDESEQNTPNIDAPGPSTTTTILPNEHGHGESVATQPIGQADPIEPDVRRISFYLTINYLPHHSYSMTMILHLVEMTMMSRSLSPETKLVVLRLNTVDILLQHPSEEASETF